jgi:superfamily II DNA helicase RecQ
VLKKQTLLVIMLLIGRGKSLLFLLLAYIEGLGVIVVVILF